MEVREKDSIFFGRFFVSCVVEACVPLINTVWQKTFPSPAVGDAVKEEKLGS